MQDRVGEETDPIAAVEAEKKRIQSDIDKLRRFKEEHSHDPQVPKAVDKLIYALIVQKNRINSGHFFG